MARVGTTQQSLNSNSVRESTRISSGLARYVSRWRVGANDKITSDTQTARYPFERSSLLRHLLTNKIPTIQQKLYKYFCGNIGDEYRPDD